MEVAANMRRLFVSRGGAGRQDALITGEGDGPSVSDGDQVACVPYEKEEKRGLVQKRKGRFLQGQRG